MNQRTLMPARSPQYLELRGRKLSRVNELLRRWTPSPTIRPWIHSGIIGFQCPERLLRLNSDKTFWFSSPQDYRSPAALHVVGILTLTSAYRPLNRFRTMVDAEVHQPTDNLQKLGRTLTDVFAQRPESVDRQFIRVHAGCFGASRHFVLPGVADFLNVLAIP